MNITQKWHSVLFSSEIYVKSNKGNTDQISDTLVVRRHDIHPMVTLLKNP